MPADRLPKLTEVVPRRDAFIDAMATRTRMQLVAVGTGKHGNLVWNQVHDQVDSGVWLRVTALVEDQVQSVIGVMPRTF